MDQTTAPESNKPAQATRSPKTTPPTPMEGAAAMARVLREFTLMPLLALAEGRNLSVRSLVQEVTGLSRARIASGNLDAVRPSTQKKIEVHQQQLLVDHFKDNPEALERVRMHIAASPRTRSGADAPWAGLIHGFEHFPAHPLPQSKAAALVVDELVEALMNACQAGDLATFRGTLVNHFEYHGMAIRVGKEPVTEPAAPSDLAAMRALEDWPQTTQLTRRLADDLYLDLISTLDVEWGRWYFGGMQSLPLLPLVMVRLQDGLLEGKKPKSPKNVFIRPQRRLLEFFYAIMAHRFNGKWDKGPARPKALAQALDLLESDVSNYFDGTRKLTYKKVDNYWSQLFKHFSKGRWIPEEMPAPPMPMVVLALHWETLLIREGGRKIVLPDIEYYNVLWKHRQRQWETLQAEREKDAPNAGHPKRDRIEWPAWMKVNQPSSSSV